MPCLSHKWLIECVSQEELLPYDAHKLAGGQGLLNGDLYPLPDVRGKLLVVSCWGYGSREMPSGH